MRNSISIGKSGKLLRDYRKGFRKKMTFKRSGWEDVAENTASKQGAVCRIKDSLFSISATELMIKYYDYIKEKAIENNIDGRAIAGAITWEYEKNLTGRYSDYFQVMYPSWNMGLGWGSIHDKAIINYLMQEGQFIGSYGELICLRMSADSAIALVAKIMAQQAEIFFNVSKGIWINNSPEVLAYFFNTGKTIESALRHKISKSQANPVALDVTMEEMSGWIVMNIERFARFKTNPKPPTIFYVPVKSMCLIPKK